MDQPPLAQANTAAQVVIRDYGIVPEPADSADRGVSGRAIRKTVGITLSEREEAPPPPPPPPPPYGDGAAAGLTVLPPPLPAALPEPGGPYDPKNPPLVVQLSPSQDYAGYTLSLQGTGVDPDQLRDRLVPIVQLQPIGLRRVFLFVHDDVPAQALTLVLDELYQVSERAKRETAAKLEGMGLDGGDTRVLLAPFGVRKFIEVGTALAPGGMAVAGIPLPVSKSMGGLRLESGASYPLLALERKAKDRGWQANLGRWVSPPQEGKAGLRKLEPGQTVAGQAPVLAQMKEMTSFLNDKRTFLAVHYDAPFATCWVLLRLAHESGSDVISFLTREGAFKRPLPMRTPAAELPKHTGAVWQRSPIPLEIPRELPKQDLSVAYAGQGQPGGAGAPGQDMVPESAPKELPKEDLTYAENPPLATRPIAAFDFSQIKVRYQPPAPPYPPLAKLAKIQGTVVVEITMGMDGVPIKAVAIDGPTQLRATAEAYAMQWRFQPAMLNGVAQTARFKLTMPFRLRS